MGANFELDSISTQFIPIDKCRELFQHMGFQFVPTKLVCADNWSWEGEQRLPFSKPSSVQRLVLDGKIVTLYGEINQKSAGIMFYQNQKLDMFETGLWFSVDLFPALDSPFYQSSDEVNRWYTQIKAGLHKLTPYGLCLAGMGVETSIKFCQTAEETINCSHASEWFIPPTKT